MPSSGYHSALGRITIVQEQRFRLATRDGRHLLMTLSHRAPLGVSELCELRDAGSIVLVRYDGEPNQESGVAREIHPV